ncbi:MAG: RNA-binding S4 domain-containing protein [Bacteroidaceae bacterium]|nr:RNA-binding S4 domain-containing protein [Bacteroidaceae bacterium]
MENERWRDQFAENAGHGREGYRPAQSENNEGGERKRTPRPRIQRAPQSSEYQARPHYNNGEGGYQPRPRYNREEGGYQPRPRVNHEGGYQPRPRYNNEEGGYQPRPRVNREEGGYQPRPRYNNGEGGYQPRPRYNNGEGGYQPRPRYNNGEGGYQPRPRYNREGGPQQGGNRYGRQHTPGYNPHAKYSMKKQIEYKEQHYDPNAPIRLNRFLANAGVCSRREADEFIQAGVVSVNGVVVTELGTKVLRTDEVRFHDETVSMEKKVYVLLNKPKDYVTTSDDPQNRKTVMDLIQGACRERIYPVGRLDRNTTGVLLMTNDGDLASKLTHPSYLKKKIYHVHLDKNVSVEDMHKISDGIELEDGIISADAVEYAKEDDKKQVGIEIHSGKNRIVRRIFEHLGYRVLKLDRVYFAGLTKKNLRRGDWRFLTEKEVNMLHMGAFE